MALTSRLAKFTTSIVRAARPVVGALVLAVATSLTWQGAGAQDAVPEIEELKQVELTEAHVKGFIDAQKDLTPLSSKLIEGGDKPDDALLGQLEDIAKKHGFKDFEEMEIVGANISLVLDGLDRESGTYTDPVEKMKLELENIQADASIGEEDKKLVIEDLNQEIAAAKPLQHAGNIEVVRKFQDDLEKLAVDGTGESLPEDGDDGADKPADGQQ